MKTGGFWWLAGVIAAHKNRQIIGRTRLQKTVYLLQRVGLPSDYLFTLFFYGPYSEGIHADLRLLEDMGLARENEKVSQDNDTYYIIQATAQADMAEVNPLLPKLHLLEQSDPVVLELAATYDAFRELGSDHDKALQQLRWKKGDKCNPVREQGALKLLKDLGLPGN